MKLWLTLEHFGTAYLRELIDLQIDRAKQLAERIAATPDLELSQTRPEHRLLRVIPGDSGPERNGGALDRAQAEIQRESRGAGAAGSRCRPTGAGGSPLCDPPSPVRRANPRPPAR
jgi:hypothetical protein